MALMILLQGVAWPLVCLMVMFVQFLVVCAASAYQAASTVRGLVLSDV